MRITSTGAVITLRVRFKHKQYADVVLQNELTGNLLPAYDTITIQEGEQLLLAPGDRVLSIRETLVEYIKADETALQTPTNATNAGDL